MVGTVRPLLWHTPFLGGLNIKPEECLQEGGGQNSAVAFHTFFNPFLQKHECRRLDQGGHAPLSINLTCSRGPHSTYVLERSPSNIQSEDSLEETISVPVNFFFFKPFSYA